MSHAARTVGSRVAVVGAGWAGLAAAIRATERGHAVTVFDASREVGGRATSRASGDGSVLDNGQHILIGAYVETLALMRQVGVDPVQAFHRTPLDLRYADGTGLTLPGGPPVLSFLRGVLAYRGWSWFERLALLRLLGGWARSRFRCHPDWTVRRLTQGCPDRVYAEFVAPLCVAALNTPAERASAQVLLTVLHDALFAGRGGADLLLPRRLLADLLPRPAIAWLESRGANALTGRRVRAISRTREGAGGALWQIDDHDSRFDAVILATPAAEAARLTAPIDSAWSARCSAIGFDSIATVYVDHPAARFPSPMLALRESRLAPAQFGFDLGVLHGAPGRYALVVSAADAYLPQGAEGLAALVDRQLHDALQDHWPPGQASTAAVRWEKRATFACTPGLDRPEPAIAPGLQAAGDYVAGPYPATLEGAVRSGLKAAEFITAYLQQRRRA